MHVYNIHVHVSMCAYAIREEYSPVSGEYLIPRVRVHVHIGGCGSVWM